MKKIAFTLPGQPATKKNSAMLVKGRNLILPSAAYRRYEVLCRKHLRKLKDLGKLHHFTMPVRLTCRYYLKDKAHWPDLMGLVQATADILSDTKDRIDKKQNKLIRGEKWVLSDDRIVRRFGDSTIAGIDKQNPRVEIEVAELEVDLETALDPYIEKQILNEQKQVLF